MHPPLVWPIQQCQNSSEAVFQVHQFHFEMESSLDLAKTHICL